MLPSALLDLTLTRLSHRSGLIGTDIFICQQRAQWPRRTLSTSVNRMQEAALASESVSSRVTLYPHLQAKPLPKTRKGKGPLGGLQVRALKDKQSKEISRPLPVELAERVEKLTEVAAKLVRRSLFVNSLPDPFQEATMDPPTFTEEELQLLYQDIIYEPSPSPLKQEASTKELDEQLANDAILVDAAYHRLQEQLVSASDVEDSPFIRALRAHTPTMTQPSPTIDFTTHSQPHRILLAQVEAFLSRVGLSASALSIPVVVMSIEEWQALIRISVCIESFQFFKVLNIPRSIVTT